MADNAARRRRGTETQVLVAQYLAERIYPHATDAGSGRQGRDILNTPGTSWEVKARRELRPLEWMRQARQAEGLPVVVFRPDGAGPMAVSEWPCIITLKDLVDLLEEAAVPEQAIAADNQNL